VISRDALVQFAGKPTTEAKPEKPANAAGFDMREYIVQRGFEVVKEKPWNSNPGGYIFKLRACVFNPDHADGDAVFTLSGDGTPGYTCPHNSCLGKTIKDVFALHPPNLSTNRGGRRQQIDADNQPALARRRAPGPPINGYTIYGTDYPLPEFLFLELLAKGLTILAGRPKSGKSWLTLQMAVSLALGLDFLGRFPCEVGKVLYFGLEEGPQRTHNRLLQLLPENDVQLQNIDFRYTLTPLAEGGAAELNVLLTAGNYDLVVIDTFLRIAKPGGPNRDVMRSEYAEISQLQQLAQKNSVAMVLVHHTRKMGAEYSLDSVAGTTGITAACDAVWTMKRLPSRETILEITGREMEEQTFGLALDTGADFGWRITSEGAEVGLSEARQDIIDLLKDEAPLSPKQVALMLRKNAVTTRRLLQKLRDDGVVQRDSSHKYSLSPGREISRTRTHVNTVNGLNDVNKVNGVNGAGSGGLASDQA
jgi:hypothetical protein